MNWHIHTDAIIFLFGIFSTGIGYALGRMERKEAEVKMYRTGYSVGKRVGYNACIELHELSK